jgi:hypothetical protein
MANISGTGKTKWGEKFRCVSNDFYTGLSSELANVPCSNVTQGTVLKIVDTGILYEFEESTATWYQQT